MNRVVPALLGPAGLAASSTAGATLDRPVEADLSEGTREKNLALERVQVFRPYSRVRVGVESLHRRTDDKANDTADANRVNTHVSPPF